MFLRFISAILNDEFSEMVNIRYEQHDLANE